MIIGGRRDRQLVNHSVAQVMDPWGTHERERNGTTASASANYSQLPFRRPCAGERVPGEVATRAAHPSKDESDGGRMRRGQLECSGNNKRHGEGRQRAEGRLKCDRMGRIAAGWWCEFIPFSLHPPFSNPAVICLTD